MGRSVIEVVGADDPDDPDPPRGRFARRSVCPGWSAGRGAGVQRAGVLAESRVSGGRPVNSARTTALTPAPGLSRSTVLHPLVRPRLDRQLTAGLSAAVTVMAAWAGWGKTLCATSWTAAGAGGRASAWVRLDAGDDDPSRFWAKLTAALAQLSEPAAAAAGRG